MESIASWNLQSEFQLIFLTIFLFFIVSGRQWVHCSNIGRTMGGPILVSFHLLTKIIAVTSIHFPFYMWFHFISNFEMITSWCLSEWEVTGEQSTTTTTKYICTAYKTSSRKMYSKFIEGKYSYIFCCCCCSCCCLPAIMIMTPIRVKRHFQSTEVSNGCQ